MSSRIATVARLRRPHAVPREGVLVGVLVIEVIALAQLSPYFLNIDDLLGAAQFFVETGLMALGMTLVIIVGGIDLSVGGSLALASVTLGFSYSAGAPLWFSILAAIGVSTAGGFLNGYLTTRWAIHPPPSRWRQANSSGGLLPPSPTRALCQRSPRGSTGLASRRLDRCLPS
jgi:predicted ABC-type sugar transport system permease subunit